MNQINQQPNLVADLFNSISFESVCLIFINF